jgi:hypothetical protein
MTEPEKAILDLESARIGTLWDEEKSWPAKGNLFLNNLVIQEIDEDAPTSAKARIKWLQLQSDKPFRPQPYKMIAEVLKKAGHEKESTEILVQKARDRIKFAELSHLQKLWGRFLGYTIGFGYQPGRALIWMLGFIILGRILFGWGYERKIITPLAKEAYVISNVETRDVLRDDYPKFNPLFYSVDLFIPVISLQQKNYWVPTRDQPRCCSVLLRYYLPVHVIAGWILTTLLLGALSGLIRR